MTEATFHDFDLPEWLQDAIEAAGYTAPTPVQAAAIPVIVGGSNVIAQAQTGTGKTAAFTIPLLAAMSPDNGPLQVLLLAPTRELARQVADEFVKLGTAAGIVTMTVYGGVAFEPQIEAFQNAHVVIATPGRLLDHLRRGNVRFDNLRVFGLDEADEMLSMGFEREVQEVVRQLPEERQTLLFSATMPTAVVRFAENFVRDAIRLDLSSDAVGASSVRHIVYRIDASRRVAALRALLRSRTVRGAIIFANTRLETFRVTELLRGEGYNVAVLNGDMAQNERERTIEQLRAETIDFLVATDIAARGIDITWLKAVINYEMPDTPETYIHRTGRTGRAGQLGTAYSFVTPGDVGCFHQLQKFFGLRMESGTLPGREEVMRARADEAIADVLEPLSHESVLDYGPYLSVARRLAESPDGPRRIAKLVAFFNANQAQLGVATPLVQRADVQSDEHAAEPVAAPQRRREPAAADVQAQGADGDGAAAPRQPRERAERPERAERTERTERPETQPATSGALDAAAVRDWILANSQPDKSFRSGHAIAHGMGLTEEQVDELAEGSPLLEQVGSGRSMWRVVDSEAAAAAPARSEERQARRPEPQRDTDAPAPREKRAERRDDRREDRRDERPARAPQREARRQPAPAIQREAHRAWTALRVNLGEDHVSEAELPDLLAELAGFDRDDVGRVQLHKRHAIIDVAEAYWRDFVDALHNQDWKDQRLNVHRAR